jgi:hypothetical protein
VRINEAGFSLNLLAPTQRGASGDGDAQLRVLPLENSHPHLKRCHRFLQATRRCKRPDVLRREMRIIEIASSIRSVSPRQLSEVQALIDRFLRLNLSVWGKADIT